MKTMKTNFSYAEWQMTILGWCDGTYYCENLFHLDKDQRVWFKLLVRAANGGELLY